MAMFRVTCKDPSLPGTGRVFPMLQEAETAAEAMELTRLAGEQSGQRLQPISAVEDALPVWQREDSVIDPQGAALAKLGDGWGWLARSELIRRPVWTIAKGVLLGLFLWGVITAVVALVLRGMW